jgi:hypothetical protein
MSSLMDARSIVRKSFVPVVYEPREKAAWDEAYARFLQVTECSMADQERIP